MSDPTQFKAGCLSLQHCYTLPTPRQQKQTPLLLVHIPKKQKGWGVVEVLLTLPNKREGWGVVEVLLTLPNKRVEGLLRSYWLCLTRGVRGCWGLIDFAPTRGLGQGVVEVLYHNKRTRIRGVRGCWGPLPQQEYLESFHWATFFTSDTSLTGWSGHDYNSPVRGLPASLGTRGDPVSVLCPHVAHHSSIPMLG